MSNIFQQFIDNLSISNSEEISKSYNEITKRLNKDFWDLESDETKHSLQVGSYGRKTAIKGVSDLDMVFELPNGLYNKYDNYETNGQSQLLQAVKSALLVKYPKTDIKGDGQVVVVNFNRYRVEVLPAFLQEDNSYIFPDTHDGGSWKACNPRAEMSAINNLNSNSNGNLKKVCKMLRTWKDNAGAPMSGMLIDTLTYKFFDNNHSYDDKSLASYPQLITDVFSYLTNLEHKEYWLAPGSLSRVYSTGNFHRKVKKATQKCQDALDQDDDTKKVKIWKEIFGMQFPASNTATAKMSLESSYSNANLRKNTEEFIGIKFPLDITYDLEIECSVDYAGKNERRYRAFEKTFPWLQLNRNLEFKIAGTNVPEPYDIYWKVRNVGGYAERNNQIRGQILQGGNRQKEHTSFGGSHYVECYIIKNGFCVARDLIDVPFGVL